MSPSQDLAEAIEEQARSLTWILTGSFPDEVDRNVIAYSLREVLRNVFEHSTARECFIAAQRWKNNRVPIAVIDEGIGIRESLRPVFQLGSDKEALSLTVRPGTTSSPADSENSGYWLYVLSELGRHYGWFALGTGESCLIASQAKKRYIDVKYKGTFVRLDVHTNFNFSGQLGQIIDRGEFEASLQGGRRKATLSSRLPF